MTFSLISIFMFLVFWRPQEWLVPWMFGIPVLDGVFYLALLALLMERDQGLIRIPTEMPQIYLLAGLFVACLASHVAHTYFQGLVDTFPEAFKICFFTIVLFSVLDRPSRFRAIAWLFVAMAAVMAWHCLLQDRRGFGFVGRPPMLIYQVATQTWQSRSFFFGIFEDPNDTAQMLVTSVPFAFLLLYRRSFWSVLMGVLISWLLIAAVLTTHSRGGMIGLLTTMGVMMILLMPGRWQPSLMVLLILGGLALCPLAAGLLDTSAYERVIFWGLANRAFKSNLVFGIGYGMFWQVASSRAPHNAYVECYTTIGTFGYWFWFGLLQLAVSGAWRTRLALASPVTEDQLYLKRYAGASMAAMAGFCASAYFLSRSFVYPLFFLIATLGALPVAAAKACGEQSLGIIKTQRDVLVMGTVGTVVSIFYIYFSIILLNKAFG